MNNYEKSCRLKLRWKTTRGNLTIEDLLDLSLQSLDRIGKTVLQEIREEARSFIQSTPERQMMISELKLEIVKDIIAEKQSKTKPVVRTGASSEEEIL